MKLSQKLMLSAIAAVVSTLALSASATAQAQQPGAQQQTAPVTDEEVKKFARAANKIAAISQKWTPQMQSAATQEEAQQIQEQVQAEMIAAIEDEGLTVQRYNEISSRAQVDEALAERIRNSA